MLHQEKELPNDSGMPLSCNNFIGKKVIWLLLEVVFWGGVVCLFIYLFFFRFPFFLSLSNIIQCPHFLQILKWFKQMLERDIPTEILLTNVIHSLF